jgi:hypothetical protein
MIYESNSKSISSPNSKILLGALALAVVIGLGMAVQAAQKDADNETDTLLLLNRRMTLFNPFTLSTRTVSANTNATRIGRDTTIGDESIFPTFLSEMASNDVERGEIVVSRPPIRIPFKPVLRSPCRP